MKIHRYGKGVAASLLLLAGGNVLLGSWVMVAVFAGPDALKESLQGFARGVSSPSGSKWSRRGQHCGARMARI